MVVMGWRLDLMILEVFSNLNDSMIGRNKAAEVWGEERGRQSLALPNANH